MKKLYAVATMAFVLCLAGLVMSGTAFADRCVDNGDGTVTDNGTGLMWQKATAGPMNWDAAMSYASSLSLAGHSRWMLPDANTLRKLHSSACKSLLEGASNSSYWLSTSKGSDALALTFDYSMINPVYKSSSLYVRTMQLADPFNTKVWRKE